MSAPASPAPSSIFGRPNSDLDLDLAASMEQTRIADEDGTAFDAAIEELRDDTPDGNTPPSPPAFLAKADHWCQ